MSEAWKKGDRVGHIHKACDGTVEGIVPSEGVVDTQPWIVVLWDDGVKAAYSRHMLDPIEA